MNEFAPFASSTNKWRRLSSLLKKSIESYFFQSSRLFGFVILSSIPFFCLEKKEQQQQEKNI